eukprot:jgi/Bigna1/76502/fgenesh1_pg.41_\
MEVEEETKPENTEKEKEDGVESMTKDEETKGAEEDEVTREAGDSDSKAEGEKEEDGSTKGNTAKTDLEEKSEEKERGEVGFVRTSGGCYRSLNGQICNCELRGEESADKKEEKNGTEHDQQQQQQQQSSTSSPSIQQPTKALTAYFLFMMENRTKVNVEEGTTLQKTLSNEWQALDPEKKKVYVERAEADKKRFQREQDEFIAAGGKIDRNEEDSGQQDNGDDSSVRSAALPMPPPSSDAE